MDSQGPHVVRTVFQDHTNVSLDWRPAAPLPVSRWNGTSDEVINTVFLSRHDFVDVTVSAHFYCTDGVIRPYFQLRRVVQVLRVADVGIQRVRYPVDCGRDL